jgi:hypothetical protein
MSRRHSELQSDSMARNIFLAGSLSFILFLPGSWHVAGQHTYGGNNYGDAFSKMLVVNSTMQSNLFSSINRANAAKREMFPELAGASRITPQEVANLCKPFPCGNEGMTASGPAPRYSAPAQPAYVAPTPRQYPITASDYRPMGGRILPNEVAASYQGDADTKEAIRALANQFLDAFEKEGRKNNVANGFGFLSSISIQVVTGRELTELEEQQLIAAFNNNLAADPRFAGMSARDKQIANEASVISGGFIAFLQVQGKESNDAKMQADARQLATAAIAYFFGVQIH